MFLTVISECGGDGGEGKGERAAKPMTAVQDCVITFVSVKPPGSPIWQYFASKQEKLVSQGI